MRALDRFMQLRPLVPHGTSPASCGRSPGTTSGRDERRLLDRLKPDLIVTFPQALEIAGADLGAPISTSPVPGRTGSSPNAFPPVVDLDW
ncbi:MAG: hypothetical protein ACRDIF_00235 [Actinomycetota bacterium]